MKPYARLTSLAALLATFSLACSTLSGLMTPTAGSPANTSVPATSAPTEPPVSPEAGTDDTSATGGVNIKDAFDDDSNGWRTGEVDGSWWKGTRLVKDGVLEFNGISKQSMFSSVLPENPALQEYVSDEVVSVNVRMPDSTMNGGAGLTLRSDSEENGFYIFLLDANGYFVFFLLNGDEWTTLVDWTEVTHFNPGDWNKMAIEAVGSHFRLSINGYQVGEADDATLPAGLSGVIVNVHEADVKILVQFDDFELWGKAPSGNSASASIIGTVIANSENSPIENRKLALCKIDGPAGDTPSDCTLQSDTVATDAQGAFQMDSVPTGNYYILYDTAMSSFTDGMAKWEGKTLKLSDVDWVIEDYCGSTNGEVTVHFMQDMQINQGTMRSLIQVLHVCDSPFALALDPDKTDVSPFVIRVTGGAPVEIEFKVGTFTQ